ncbi:MAG: TetR family transcriptional regulator, partial [Candidatus Geothermincolia bacterium]
QTAPNLAFYDPGYVDMVNSIKILQREKGLSLNEIKELLEQGQFTWPEGFPPEDFSGVSGTAGGSRRALDRRKHIMSVAARVFAEKGYYATTIADLAQAAGIAKGTIYWYFNNKRAIMLAILDDMSHEITGTFGQILANAPDGLEALLRCVEPALELLETHGPIYLMYFLEIGSTDNSIKEKFQQIYKVVHAGAKVAVVRGMKEGKIRDLNADIAAYAVMGMVERVSEISGLSDLRVPMEVRAGETRELVRRALSARPGSKR